MAQHRRASTITVLGHEFNVLPSALSSLSEFDIGDSITLLLTGDANPAVAGVVSSSSARTNAVGVVTDCSTSSATVKLLGSNLELSGNPNLSDPGSVSWRASWSPFPPPGWGRLPFPDCPAVELFPA